jgi:predicted RNA-binding protein (virulence factor B family)
MILEIGKKATLRVVKELDFGIYLDGGPYGEILLPIKQVPEETAPEDQLEVFIYCDSEDRLIATTLTPKAMVGEFAFLEVVDKNEFGAFLDWGIPTKHLFVPFKEQVDEMTLGRSYIVYIYLDEKTDRIVGSCRLNRYLEPEAEGFEVSQEVEILVAKRTDLGFKAIVNGGFWGILYQNELFKTINVGDKMTAFVKKVREDKKLDLVLNEQGFRAMIDPASDKILGKLDESNGYLPLTDKSPPQLIYDVFQMSKKAFKRAIGNLYKRKLINIAKDGIYLMEKK